MGAFQQSGDSLDLSGIARTMMAGPGLEFEDKFVRALNGINTFAVTDTELVLSKNGAAPVLRFKADASASVL